MALRLTGQWMASPASWRAPGSASRVSRQRVRISQRLAQACSLRTCSPGRRCSRALAPCTRRTCRLAPLQVTTPTAGTRHPCRQGSSLCIECKSLLGPCEQKTPHLCARNVHSPVAACSAAALYQQGWCCNGRPAGPLASAHMTEHARSQGCELRPCAQASVGVVCLLMGNIMTSM